MLRNKLAFRVFVLIVFSSTLQSSFAGTYSDTVLATPGLQGYWRLGESTGDFFDSGPNGFIGTPQKVGDNLSHESILYAQPGPQPSEGFLGFETNNLAVGFDPAGPPSPRTNRGWISVADDDRLDPLTGDFTIEAWFINDGNNPAEYTWGIAGKIEYEGANAFRSGYSLMYDYWDQSDSVAIRYGAQNGIPQVISSPAIPAAPNQWHYIVAVLHRNRTENDLDYQVSGASVFLDGVLMQTVESLVFDGDPGFDLNTPKAFAIGGLSGGGSFTYRGSVDEVAVYNRALSPDEVTAHYAAAFIPGSTDLPGDFNGDGHVDGRDFLLWQRDTTVGNLADWQANYGATASLAAIATSPAAVPEPGGLALMLTAAYGLAIRRNRMATRNTKGPKGLSH